MSPETPQPLLSKKLRERIYAHLNLEYSQSGRKPLTHDEIPARLHSIEEGTWLILEALLEM